MSRVCVDVWVYGCVRCLSRVCVRACVFSRALKMCRLAAGQTTIPAVQYWCCIVGDGRSHLSKCAVRIMLQIGGKNSNVLFLELVAFKRLVPWRLNLDASVYKALGVLGKRLSRERPAR
jgi:hypothetical protein